MNVPETKSMADLPAIPGPVMLDRLVGWFFGMMPLSGLIYEVSQIVRGTFAWEWNGVRTVTYVLSLVALLLVAMSRRAPMRAALVLLLANVGFLVWCMAEDKLFKLSATFLGLEVVAILYVWFRLNAMKKAGNA